MISEQQMANAVRFLAVDAVQKAGSGHPGTPLGMADIATLLWTKIIKFDATCPEWPDRDRFILSAGHASAMLYALFYLSGFQDISLEDLKNFRQLDSKTAGHPEYGLLKGIEATTGPLGQGIGMAVGMAIAEKIAAARFGSDLVNHRTWVLAGDGDLMEGISEEAISLAGHLKLNKLTLLWDNNSITIDGSTTLSTSTDQKKRFEACGWQVFEVDGHSPEDLFKVIQKARQSDKPAMIACKTTIGYGAPTKAGTSAAHGAPLGEEEIQGLRQNLKWPYPPFEIPNEVLTEWRNAGLRGSAERQAWEKRLKKSEKRKAFTDTLLQNNLPENFETMYQTFKNTLLIQKPNIASRNASQMALEKIMEIIPNMIGGSADLSPSNLTKATSSKVISAENFDGNYIEYGIREHAMGAIMNGLALSGGFIPYGGTFLVFADYLKPAMRLASMMRKQVIYVFTHDSIGVGEDGPTHQPIEQLAMLRSLPNLITLRPCDALETAECWQIALQHKNGPSALILSRQKLPFLRTQADINLSERGAYVISPAKGEKAVTLIATGSEVALAIQTQALLSARGIEAAVVSMPSMELFNQQSKEYQTDVLGNKLRISIEAASTFGWTKYADYSIGIDRFGLSAPAEQVYTTIGLTPQVIENKVLEALHETVS